MLGTVNAVNNKRTAHLSNLILEAKGDSKKLIAQHIKPIVHFKLKAQHLADMLITILRKKIDIGPSQNRTLVVRGSHFSKWPPEVGQNITINTLSQFYELLQCNW